MSSCEGTRQPVNHIWRSLLLCVTLCASAVSNPSPGCHLQIASAYEDYEYVQDGDIVIGGIFSVHCFMGGKKVHAKPNTMEMFCVKPLLQYYKNLQIFLYTIDQVNKNLSILCNVTLGYHIFDSCSDPRKAVKSSLQILSGPGKTVPNYSCRNHQKLAGFIGEQSATTTLPMAQILSLFNYVHISYGAADLSLNTFQSFYYTVSPDYEIYFCILQLIRHFGWTWIGIIASADESGEKESTVLSIYFAQNHICVAFLIRCTHSMGNPTIKGQIDAILRSSVNVVVLCGSYHDAIFESWVGKSLRDVTIILPPGWAPNIVLIEKYPDIFNCSLSLNYWSEADEKLKSFVDRFHPKIFPKDKVLENLWMTKLLCLSGNKEKDDLYERLYQISLHNCTGLEHLPDYGDYSSNRTTDPVYRAVELIVYGLHSLYSSQNTLWLDGQVQNKQNFRNKVIWHLNKITHDDRFKPLIENRELFSLQNHIIVNGTLFTRNVGHFHKDSLGCFLYVINNMLINWKNGNNQIPRSQCSESCLPGHRKVPGTSIQPCCHGCVQCSFGEESNITDSENCMKCSDYEWPNENRTRCISKQVEFLSFTHDKISVVFIFISVLFCSKTFSFLLIFILYQDTPVVKANNKILSFVLLVSIMLGFLCVFLFLGRPVDVTCLLRQISFGILFTIAVSSVLAKTIMVCIAFKATKPNSVWRQWIGVKLPICIVLACSSVQVIICVSWLSISPPFQELDTHSYQEKIIVQCNEGSVIGFYSVLGYMGILAAVSFILAFLARTLPDRFNEAKYITFSMLVYCSVWIAMIPAYLSTKGKYTVAVEIFAILISNGGLLYCIFLPKCFIILCRPELNTKIYLR